MRLGPRYNYFYLGMLANQELPRGSGIKVRDFDEGSTVFQPLALQYRFGQSPTAPRLSAPIQITTDPPLPMNPLGRNPRCQSEMATQELRDLANPFYWVGGWWFKRYGLIRRPSSPRDDTPFNPITIDTHKRAVIQHDQLNSFVLVGDFAPALAAGGPCIGSFVVVHTPTIARHDGPHSGGFKSKRQSLFGFT